MNNLVELKMEFDFPEIESSQLKKWIPDIKLLEEIVKKYKAEVRKRAEEDDKTCGWEMEIQNAGLEFNDLNEVYKTSGLNMQIFIECCKVGITELRKRFAEANPDMKKNDAIKELDERLSKIGTMKTKKVLKEIKEII